METVTPLVELAHVSKTYVASSGADPVRVLQDVSLELAPGEAVAITGPSGSGKSTLLNMIGALDRPTTGRVSLGGRDLSALSDDELARIRNREIGFVFQLHHLLPQCTAFENVLVPTLAEPARRPPAVVAERARQLLARVGLAARLNHRPAQLSGGERQRVAVVRALINTPKLLLADEPTGSLDHTAARQLADILLELNRELQVALVVVTHSRDLALRMPRQLELTDGRLLDARLPATPLTV